MSETNGRVEKLRAQLDEAVKLAQAEQELFQAKESGNTDEIKAKKTALVEATKVYRAYRDANVGLTLIPPTVAAKVSAVNNANDNSTNGTQ